MEPTKYLIMLHNVPHEIQMYVEEIKMHGDILYHSQRYPTNIWLESYWEQGILEEVIGVKKVYPKRMVKYSSVI